MPDEPDPQPVYALIWPTYEVVEREILDRQSYFVGLPPEPTEPPPTQETL